MISWLHTHTPNSVLFDFGFITIYWYGLLLMLGALAGFLVARYLFKKSNIEESHVINLFFYLVIFGLLGGRFYHVLNEYQYYLEYPWQIFAFWNGGLAIHGALIFGAVTLWLYIRKNKKALRFLLSRPKQNQAEKSTDAVISAEFSLANTFLFFLDILAPAVLIGQVIGRWGNYFNQELYGLPCDFSWCIPIQSEFRVAGFESFTHFHPTFLYETLLNLLLFIILILLHRHRIKSHSGLVSVSACHPEPVDVEKQKQTQGDKKVINYSGSILAIYLIGYGIIRMMTEFLRIDTTPIIAGIRLPIIVSCLLLIVGFWLMWYSKSSKENCYLYEI